MLNTKSIFSAVAFFGLACGLALQAGSENSKIKTCNAKLTDTGWMTETTEIQESLQEITSASLVTAPVITTNPVTATELSTEITTTVTETATSAADTTPEEQVSDETVNPVHGVISGEILHDISYTEYPLPENPYYSGFKSYEPYYMITAQSVQLYLEYDAVTDADGFRLLDNRYLVAVGTFCNAPCGTYIDLLLDNGVLIPCIVGDIKADVHTDETNTYTSSSMCASEFIVDDSICPAAWSGNVSTVYGEWEAKVQAVRVYSRNYFG